MTEFSFLCKFILEFSCVLSICVSSLKLQCTEHWLSATQRLLLFSVSSLHLSSIKCERQNVIRQLVFWFLTFSDYHLHSPECVLWHLIEHHGEPARHTHTHTHTHTHSGHQQERILPRLWVDTTEAVWSNVLTQLFSYTSVHFMISVIFQCLSFQSCSDQHTVGVSQVTFSLVSYVTS